MLIFSIQQQNRCCNKMKAFRMLKNEETASLDTVKESSSEEAEESPTESLSDAATEDPADSIIFAKNTSVETFTISKMAQRPEVRAEKKGETEEDIAADGVSLGELLQKVRRLDKVTSKISCAELMLNKELISKGDLENILKKQGETKGYFHQIIADMDLVPRKKILEVAAEGWGGLDCIDLAEEEDIEQEIIKMIPEAKARRGVCIPVYKDETTLFVAMADPLDIFAADDIKISLRATGFEFEIEPLLAFPKDIEKKLEEVYGLGDTIIQEILDGIQEQGEIMVESGDEVDEDEDLDIALSMEMAQQGPIIGLVNAILLEEIGRASCRERV